MAREHLAAVADIAGVQILAVCDLSSARAESTAERFGIARWFVDYEEMLKEVRPDLVHITTPPASHFEIAKSCLQKHLNVFCEKPITLRHDSTRALIEEARVNGCLLVENHNMLYHSTVNKIKDVVRSGELGEVVDVQVAVQLYTGESNSSFNDRNFPHFTSAMPLGVASDLLPHVCYLATLFAGEIRAVSTLRQKRSPDSIAACDEFRALLEGSNAPAYVSFSGISKLNAFWLRVTGTKMQLEADLWEPPRLIIRRVRASEPALGTLLNGFAEANAVLSGSLAAFYRKLGGVSSYDGLREIILATYAALDGSKAPPVTLDQIDRLSALLAQLSES